MSVLQTIGDAVQNGLAPTVVGMVNLVGIAAVSIQNWRGRVASVKEVAETKIELVTQFSALDSTVKAHIDNTPTLATCATHIADVQHTITDEGRTLREEVAVLMLEHGHDVRVLEERVTDLAVKEGIRTGRNGVE